LYPPSVVDDKPIQDSTVSYRRTGSLHLVDDEATLQRLYRPGLMGLLLRGEWVTR
jgi:hypothetical protein